MDAEYVEKVFASWREAGCLSVIDTNTNLGIVGLMPMAYTWGVFVDLSPEFYGYRYCFDTLLDAQIALEDWQANNFSGEPEGYIVRKGLGEDKRGQANVS